MWGLATVTFLVQSHLGVKKVVVAFDLNILEGNMHKHIGR